MYNDQQESHGAQLNQKRKYFVRRRTGGVDVCRIEKRKKSNGRTRDSYKNPKSEERKGNVHIATRRNKSCRTNSILTG